MSSAIRFIALTDSTAGPLKCWLWTGDAHDDHGYGLMHLEGRVVRATHVALMLDERPRPAGMYALHHCDNPPCVNPAHLYWGTQKRNMQDARDRSRTNAGVRNGMAKLTPEIAQAIRRDRSQGDDYQTLAERYGVGKSTISRVMNMQTWAE